MEQAGPGGRRIPYSVRKGRLRQAKQAEEGKLLATSVNKAEENREKKKDTKAYVVEVQIPVTPEPIVLQSKFPIDESAVMNFSQPAGPEPVVDNRPVKVEMVSSVKTAQPTETPEPVVVKQAPPAELEPVKETLVTGPDTATVVEALPAQPKPVMIEEAPLGKSEHTIEETKKPVTVEVIKAIVEDEVLATPIIKDEKVSVHPVVEKEPAPPPPKMETPSAPVDEENVEIIPAATRLKGINLLFSLLKGEVNDFKCVPSFLSFSSLSLSLSLPFTDAYTWGFHFLFVVLLTVLLSIELC
ncbi:unnamed protein product [Acanthosepion pharaonis]|uniref:Uncharacterized protein n=1 Tax=Acanthosepion pharaonis TaxID=158019 RepID=A0A812E0Y5_ACAPH|nr:unnamed protein product [Sepia pharaonis]